MGKVEHKEAMNHNEMCVYVLIAFVHIMFNSSVKSEKFGARSKYKLIVDMCKSKCS